MLLIRAILLWSLISLHVIGGAACFRRLFPRESPWFGFIVPALALVIVMNFIEHLVAVPTLLGLLPFTVLGSVWALFSPRLNWKGFRLPTAIFLASFAFTLALRAVKPDIGPLRDGLVDLGLTSSYCLGAKVPPPICWFPALPFSHYYSFGHYGISVLTRLLNVDIGTGFNLSSALLSAFDLFLAAAAAWRVSRQKVWVTLLVPILTAGAATGATAYLWFTTQALDPNEADDIFSGLDDSNSHSPLLKLIHDGCRHELVPAGAWSWIGSFHSTTGGLFLVLFLVWSLMEVLRRRPSNVPWICFGSIPFLTIDTSTWALPFEVLLLAGALFCAWRYKFFPRNLRAVMLGIGAVVALMAPTLLEFLTSAIYTGGGWTDPNCRTQLVEFLVLWWPAYLPLLALVFVWPKLPPAVKIITVAVPVTFFGMEIYTIGNPYDWTGKLWGYIYGAAWITLVPAVFSRRAIPFRALTLVLIASSLISFWAWGSYYFRDNPLDDGDLLHLEGMGSFRHYDVQNRLLLALSRIKGQTIFTGKSGSGDSPFLAAFTNNRIYVAWALFIDGHVSGAEQPMAQPLQKEVDDFYDGKCADPLLFLRARDISAVVIYPDDKIDTKILDKLKQSLASCYEYVDCRVPDAAVNSGVFFFHPGMLKEPVVPIWHSP